MGNDGKERSPAAAGCMLLLLGWLLLAAAPSVLLWHFGETHHEMEETPEQTVVVKAVSVRGMEVARLKATVRRGTDEEAVWDLSTARIPWARAEGRIAPAEDDDRVRLQWRLVVGLLGFAQEEGGTMDLPVPPERAG